MALIRVVLDFETAYGRHPDTGENITLNCMTNEEYIRHPKFKAHGLGVKVDNEPAKYLTGKSLARFLKTNDWSNTFAIAHHAHFDGAILAWRAGIRPKFWGCTLSMARALYPHESASLANLSKYLGIGEKGHELVTVKDKWVLTEDEQRVLGGYCATNRDSDVNLTAKAFDIMVKDFPVSELRVIDTTVRMFTEPELMLDPPLLEEEIAAEIERKQLLLDQIAHEKSDLMSNDKFAEILLSLGVDPPKKLSPSKVKDDRVNPDEVGDAPIGILPCFKAPKKATAEAKAALKEAKRVYPWTYAFGKSDEAFKMLLDHPDAIVGAVVEARMGVKSTINETRAGRMLAISGRGAWPVYLTYCAATTFRFGGGDKVNPQNFTRGSRLRRAIMAPVGKLQAISDLSQIEARVLAVLAGQDDLVEQFARNEDVYCNMATSIFGRIVTKADKDKRFMGKAVVLGAGYGMGWSKFSQLIRVGMLGNKGILFGTDIADALGISLDSFTGRYYEKALESRPSNVTENDHLLHCACAKGLIDRYRLKNDKIPRLWRAANGIIPAMAAEEDWEYTVGVEPELKVVPGGILMPNGLTMQYHNLKLHEGGQWTRTTRKGRKIEQSRMFGGSVVENICQCLARIVITEAMNRMTAAGMKPVMQVHDELVCVDAEQTTEATFQKMQRMMQVRPKWMPSLPLDSEGGVDKRYVK